MYVYFYSPFGVQVWMRHSLIQTCTPNGRLYRVTYARCRIDTINSPDDGHMAARNMRRIEINIREKRVVRQVGYLQRLHREEWPTEHKKYRQIYRNRFQGISLKRRHLSNKFHSTTQHQRLYSHDIQCQENLKFQRQNKKNY
jgi:hypothetical protein